jgi:hypothetical protein
MKTLAFLLALLFTSACFGAPKTAGEILGQIPVQDAGRLKPFDTFAQEALQLVHGRSKYQGRDANEIVFTWLLIPEHWMETEFVQLGNAGVKEALKVDKETKYLSPHALLANERLPLIFQELQNLVQAHEKLNPYYSAVQHLQNQLDAGLISADKIALTAQTIFNQKLVGIIALTFLCILWIVVLTAAKKILTRPRIGM